MRSSGVMDYMKKYNRREKRLDKFWMEIFEISHKENLVQLILILSHGNAALEPGFSINKEAIVENSTESSLIY